MSESCGCIKGICCEVDTCAHNDGHGACCAAGVTIRNRMALLGEETMCDTFEEKE